MYKQYAERDIVALDEQGGHYFRHVMAMTSEGLHSKSDIAAELAYRDRRIQDLEERLEIDPAHPFDGIDARDETIRGLEQTISKREIKWQEIMSGKSIAEHDAQLIESLKYRLENSSFAFDSKTDAFTVVESLLIQMSEKLQKCADERRQGKMRHE